MQKFAKQYHADNQDGGIFASMLMLIIVAYAHAARAGTYVRTHTQTHTYTHAYAYARTHRRTRTHMALSHRQTNMNAHTRKHLFLFKCSFNWCVRVCLNADSEAVYVLSFSSIILNTDAHNPAIIKKMKMSKEQFLNSNKGINAGKVSWFLNFFLICDNQINT